MKFGLAYARLDSLQMDLDLNPLGARTRLWGQFCLRFSYQALQHRLGGVKKSEKYMI
jgi:hypothetical protein